MNRLTALVAVVLLSICSTSYGQMWNWGYSSTAAQGYWTGLGQYYSGRADYLQGLGSYLNAREHARRLNTDNWAHDVRTEWSIQDENHKRNRPVNPLDARSHQLDMVEKRVTLAKREEDLRNKGVLPQKQAPAFFYNGKKHKSYADFKAKGGNDYQEFRADVMARRLITDLKEKGEQQRQEEALQFLASWRSMDFFGQQKYLHDRKVEALLNSDLPRTENYKVITPKKKVKAVSWNDLKRTGDLEEGIEILLTPLDE